MEYVLTPLVLLLPINPNPILLVLLLYPSLFSCHFAALNTFVTHKQIFL